MLPARSLPWDGRILVHQSITRSDLENNRVTAPMSMRLPR